jgi:hypothetical protein
MTSRSNGRKEPMAALSPSPRPAKPSPSPRRFPCTAARVRASNVSRKSSNSTGAGRALASGIVSPSAKARLDVPRVT